MANFRVRFKTVFDEAPRRVTWLIGILLIIWAGSLAILLAPLFEITIPLSPAAAATFSSATASIVLVLVTTWHVTSHRELVEETKEARIQGVSPLLVPEFEGGLTPTSVIYLRNIGNGPAFDVTAKFILEPAGDEYVLWESAPLLPPDQELQSHQPLHGGDKKEAVQREEFFGEYSGLRIEANYEDALGRQKEYAREFDFDFQYEMHNSRPIEKN